MHVSLPVGQTAIDLEHCAEAIAVAMSLRDVKVTRDPANARNVAVRLIHADPLGETAPPWPMLSRQTSSIWSPVPVGVDEDGRPVVMQLIERNVLIGGEPGAGKSSALALLTAAAALDPNVELVLFDGKLVELACWAGSAKHSVGPNVGQAVDVLGQMVSDLDARYSALLANRQRRVTPQDDIPVRVLVFDELAHYFLAAERAERASFERLLRDLVARGRAAGVIVLAATQKPQHDVIPTAVRDLFAVRWAMRCTTPQASDTILGSGWAASGYRACDVPMSSPGVGLLLHEGATPVRMRSHLLTDNDLTDLARVAESHRVRSMS
jgi:DNA segregation ATPase FtsK/SpoIIIE-like protein